MMNEGISFWSWWRPAVNVAGTTKSLFGCNGAIWDLSSKSDRKL